MSQLSHSAARSFSVGEVLPHAGRMLLLDEVLEFGPEHVACRLGIRRDTLFCDAMRGVPAWVGIEYMAQTAGVYSGVNDRLAGREPAVCLLLGARTYKSHVPYFEIGSTASNRGDIGLARRIRSRRVRLFDLFQARR